MLGWPIAHALLRPGSHGRYRAALVASLLGALLLLTNQRALVWGNPQLLGALSATHEADSARAKIEAARQLAGRGDGRSCLAQPYIDNVWRLSWLGPVELPRTGSGHARLGQA